MRLVSLLDGLADEFDLLEALGVALVFDLDQGILLGWAQNLRLLDRHVLARGVVGARATFVTIESLLVMGDNVVLADAGADS